MKKIVFLIVCIIYGFSCFGQQVVDLNGLASINLPDGAKKISKEQALSHASERFNNDKIVLGSISRRATDHIYKVDNILISFFTDNHSVSAGHLLANKKSYDELFKDDTSYTSSLKKVNNNSVMIINYKMGDVEYYHFTCYNASNSIAATGVLEFNKIDANEASGILNDVIKSITFKSDE